MLLKIYEGLRRLSGKSVVFAVLLLTSLTACAGPSAIVQTRPPPSLLTECQALPDPGDVVRDLESLAIFTARVGGLYRECSEKQAALVEWHSKLRKQ